MRAQKSTRPPIVGKLPTHGVHTIAASRSQVPAERSAPRIALPAQPVRGLQRAMAPAAAAATAACVMTSASCTRPFASGGARPAFAAQRRRRGAGGFQRCSVRAEAAAGRIPSFIPEEFAAEIEEPAARAMMAAMRRVSLDVPGLGQADTAFVGPEAPTPDRPAFVLLHGAVGLVSGLVGIGFLLARCRLVVTSLLPRCPATSPHRTCCLQCARRL